MFYEKRKINTHKMTLFSVDQLFFTKQKSKNAKNIFLKIIFNEPNGLLINYVTCHTHCFDVPHEHFSQLYIKQYKKNPNRTSKKLETKMKPK